MKKSFFLFVILAIFITACTRITPGNVGFKVSYSGNYRGVDSIPLENGWVWYFPFTSHVVSFPVSMQHVVYSNSTQEGGEENQELTLGCKGGSGFYVNVGLNYTIIASKASHIYLKYKTDDLDVLNQGYIRNTVRKVMNDLAGTYTMDSLLSNRPSYEREAEAQLKVILGKDGFDISQLSILDNPRPTDKMIAQSISNKIRAKQDAETEQMKVQQSIAQANQKIAEAKGDSASKMINAAGTAKANALIQQSLTDLLIQKLWIERWNGQVSQYNLGGSTPLIQIPH
jgi:regulator of protease activity HflC (stomatin/prohibitin superfamily)